MGFVIGFLTFLMIVDCLILVLLVLVQLPKKEAGVGIAFGGAAADALFGAGSGNVLTKATKYIAGIFFALSLFLSILQSHFHHQTSSEFERQVEKQSSQTAPEPNIPTSPNATAPTAAGAAAATNLLLPETTPAAPATDSPASTNSVPAAPPQK